jgi:hypothetical protein
MDSQSRIEQSRANQPRVTRTLIDHFFRRFFDNDTVQVDADTQTTVVRALAIVTAPGIAIGFRLANQYPDPRWSYPRPPWAAIGDQYCFVLLSFVVMGAVSIFEWEMLFPDRLDFLVLSPLSVKPLQMLAAKAAALVAFLALFLFSCNVFGIVMLPAVSHGDFFRQIYAHAVAVFLAGTFAHSSSWPSAESCSAYSTPRGSAWLPRFCRCSRSWRWRSLCCSM